MIIYLLMSMMNAIVGGGSKWNVTNNVGYVKTSSWGLPHLACVVVCQ